jgi:hypothetical protein
MTGIYIGDEITPWAGRSYVQFNYLLPSQMLNDVYIEINAGEFFAVLGYWASDPLQHWAWFHGYTGAGPDHWYFWDQFLGDHIFIDTATFLLQTSTINRYSAGVGAYVPYL